MRKLKKILIKKEFDVGDFVDRDFDDIGFDEEFDKKEFDKKEFDKAINYFLKYTFFHSRYKFYLGPYIHNRL